MSSEGNVERSYFYIQGYDSQSFLMNKFFHVPSGDWVKYLKDCTHFSNRQGATAYLNEFGLKDVAEVKVYIPGKLS